MSVAAILAESAARWPDRVAIAFGPQRVRYDELWLRARQYAAVLRDRGVRAGDKIGLLLANTPDFAMAYFGVLAAGAVVVPIHGLLKANEIAHILQDCEAKVLLCGVPFLKEVARVTKTLDVRVLTVMATADAAAPWPDVVAEASTPIDRYVYREPGDVALVLYTSGTTGRPKGAVLTHFNVTMNVAVTARSPFEFREHDVLLGCLPLSHVFGQICGMCTCFLAGAKMVLMEKFHAVRALDLMVEERCTVLMGVPTMYVALLDAVAHDQRRPPLDRAYSGGSSLPMSILHRFQKIFCCPIYEGYGLTETSPVVAYNQKPWPIKPGTVGRAIWGVDVEIARADVEGRIELLPAGERGEIVIRGHNVMAGYLNRLDATDEVMVDGWFRSGDIGMKDDEGYIAIVDRKKDMVLRGGYSVYPREIEDVLLRHPSVAQVAVIGLPHDVHGEEVCAVVIPSQGADPRAGLAEEIIQFGREHLAAYKYPRIVKFTDTFPIGPSGKVLKRELVAWVTRPYERPAFHSPS